MPRPDLTRPGLTERAEEDDRAEGADRAAPAVRGERLAWALPVVLLAAVGVGVLIVRSGPGWLGPAAVALLVGAGLVWIGVSVFWPAKADRRCPACGKAALERLDPETTRGLRCTACGHVDGSATGWFLAEEEGPLEELVLLERARKRSRKHGRDRARA